jgi:DNA-binding response OmpR family regulator
MATEFQDKPAFARARVLLADADSGRLRRLRLALVRSGRWIVTVAGNFDRAMQELVASEFDLLVVDPELPGGGEAGVLRRLREAGPAGGVPKVALLHDPAPTARIEAWRLGVVDCIELPVSDEELVVRLSAAIAHGRPRETGPARLGDLAGRLSCISFAEVVSVLSASRRGGTLSLWTGRGRGKVLFHDGRIVHAEFDRRSGHEAIFALMSEEHGTFDFQHVDLAVDRVHRTVTWDATTLILEGARLIDEKNREEVHPTSEPSRL